MGAPNMAAVLRRTAGAVVLLVALSLVLAQGAAAHSGEGVSMEHVIIEVATWALAIAAVIAIIVGIFWVRARASRR